MSHEPPIPWPYCRIPARFPGDPEASRTMIQWIQQVLAMTSSHRPHTWGFAIVRTAYDNDALFQRALDLINRAVYWYSDIEHRSIIISLKHAKELFFIDLDALGVPMEADDRPNREFLRQYENDILEDPARLDGASIDQVRAYFSEWVDKVGGDANYGDMRYAACIMLDAETLAHLATVPDDFTSGIHYNCPYWVKMVEAFEPPPVTFRIRVSGMVGLVEYWFDRHYRRKPAAEIVLDWEDEDPSILYYGLRKPPCTWGPLPDT